MKITIIIDEINDKKIKYANAELKIFMREVKKNCLPRWYPEILEANKK